MNERRADLVETTLKLLSTRVHTLTLKSIASETKIEISWLSRLQHGGVKDPSARKIQRLYEHLSGRQLDL